MTNKFIDQDVRREPVLKFERDPKRAAELATQVDLSRNRLTLREKQEHCAQLGVQPLDDDEIRRLYPSPNPETIDQIEEETMMLNPANFGKVKEKSDRLAAVLKLREKLRAGEPLELIIGTGGTAQSITLTPDFVEVVRAKMLHDLGADALQLAEEMRELGVLVALPL